MRCRHMCWTWVAAQQSRPPPAQQEQRERVGESGWRGGCLALTPTARPCTREHDPNSPPVHVGSKIPMPLPDESMHPPPCSLPPERATKNTPCVTPSTPSVHKSKHNPCQLVSAHRLQLEEHVEGPLEVGTNEVELKRPQAIHTHGGRAANLPQALLHFVPPHVDQGLQLCAHLHPRGMSSRWWS